jgi:hypothetical protein
MYINLEKRERNRTMKGIKRRIEDGEGMRHEMNDSTLNFNGISHYLFLIFESQRLLALTIRRQ